MDPARRLGDELLRRYRNGSLTFAQTKDAVLQAAKESEDAARLVRIRSAIRTLHLLSTGRDVERIRHYARLILAENGNGWENGGGI